MRISPRHQKIIAIFFLLFFTPFVFAADTQKNKKARKALQEGAQADALQYDLLSQNKDLTELQKQARAYRYRGLELQRLGNIDEAYSFYQKAIELDLSYAAAYNDLGVIYEIKGSPDEAESAYLTAIKVDPSFLSAYTNLALFYESKRDLKKALFYWHRRVALGLPDDPWTQKARKRAADIGIVSGGASLQFREQEIVDLVNDQLQERLRVLKEDDRSLSAAHFQKAQLIFRRGNEIAALKEAINAQQLDPENAEIEEFIDKIQAKLLSR